MASITVINRTNGPINSATPDSATDTISSVRNIISPNEFYVHSAAVQYDLVVRHYIGPNSLFHSNWERVGEIMGMMVLDLVAVGLSFIGIGQAVATLRAAITAGQLAGLLAKAGAVAGEIAGLVVLDGASIGITSKDIAIDGKVAGDAVYTDIHGHENNIFIIEGGVEFQIHNDGKVSSHYNELTMRKISGDEFNTMKQANEIYELSEEGYPIFIENGQRFYMDADGRKIFNPDGDEYYKEGSKVISYDRNDRKKSEYSNLKVTRVATGNDSGQASWQNWVYTKRKGGQPAAIQGIEVINQPGNGIINARLLYDDGSNSGMSYWTCDEMGSNNATHYIYRSGAIDPVQEVCIREEAGYGIVDIKLIHKSGKDSNWLVQNDFDASKKSDYAIKNLGDYTIVGFQGKKQGSYGLVDMRFKYLEI